MTSAPTLKNADMAYLNAYSPLTVKGGNMITPRTPTRPNSSSFSFPNDYIGRIATPYWSIAGSLTGRNMVSAPVTLLGVYLHRYRLSDWSQQSQYGQLQHAESNSGPGAEVRSEA